MKEKFKNIISKLYSTYQKVINTVGTDRVLHLTVSLTLTIIGALLFHHLASELATWQCALLSGIIIFLIGRRKELIDAKFGGGFDRIDLLFDGIGCIGGFLLCVCYM